MKSEKLNVIYDELRGRNMQVGIVFETAEWRDYHENYLREILAPFIRKHRQGLIELHNGTTLHLFTARQCKHEERFVGFSFDNLFEFISDQKMLIKVRKTLFPRLKYRLGEPYDTELLHD